MQGTNSCNDQSTDHSSIYKSTNKPLSTVEIYSNAKRLNDEYQFGITELIITAIVCLIIGTLIGSLSTFLLGQ